MKKIVIFAGTTEGRRLSEILADAGIAHTVCVATEYGEIVMREQTDAEAAGTKGQPLVSLHLVRQWRPRAHQAHLATQHVEQLRKLINAVFADEAADTCYARIVLYLDKRTFVGMRFLFQEIFFRYDEIV